MNAVEVVETLIPKQIQSAKESILNPENEGTKRKLEEVWENCVEHVS